MSASSCLPDVSYDPIGVFFPGWKNSVILLLFLECSCLCSCWNFLFFILPKCMDSLEDILFSSGVHQAGDSCSFLLHIQYSQFFLDSCMYGLFHLLHCSRILLLAGKLPFLAWVANQFLIFSIGVSSFLGFKL